MQVQPAPDDSEDLIRQLKKRADRERREIVRRLVETAIERGVARPTQRQLTSESLDRLAGTSATVGNHTWDHPTLDTCEPPDQVVQIRRAHSFLRQKTQVRPVLAYPNGNWTLEAETAAQDLGYRLGLMFDHRLTDMSAPRFRWSRLRVSSDSPIRRFASILSGAHPRFHRRREAMQARALARGGRPGAT
jgi:peptidoglycan/xylan/chitin deacetylase (PgdA/CDA1 family)